MEECGGHARSLVLIARELRAGGARRHHGRRPPDHDRPAPAVPQRPRAEPLRQRGTLPAQAAARAARQAAAAGCISRWRACRGHRTGPGARPGEGEHESLARGLIDVGLAEMLECTFLRFDPALGPFLLHELDDSARAAAEAHWAETADSQGFSTTSKTLTPRWPLPSRFTICPTCWRRWSGARGLWRAVRSAWSR